MTRLKDEIKVAVSHTVYRQIAPGLEARSFTVGQELFVRVRKGPAATASWERAWEKVRDDLGLVPGELRMERRIHMGFDGSETRQVTMASGRRSGSGQASYMARAVDLWAGQRVDGARFGTDPGTVVIVRTEAHVDRVHIIGRDEESGEERLKWFFNNSKVMVWGRS